MNSQAQMGNGTGVYWKKNKIPCISASAQFKLLFKGQLYVLIEFVKIRP